MAENAALSVPLRGNQAPNVTRQEAMNGVKSNETTRAFCNRICGTVAV